MKDDGKYKILFVCLGNICRSPSAQAVMQHLIDERGQNDKYYLDSAGTYGGHAGSLPDPRMRQHAKLRGYDLTHRSRKVTGNDFEDFDLIVAMDNGNVRSLEGMAATVEEARKIVMLGKWVRKYPHYDYVPDPYYEGSEGFELVMDLLEDACGNLLDEIEARRNRG
ncbi:MAG: low molecular weight protein-tyrosine-phosphatase [Sodaliphilus sp.]|nr:low molecular weight protein-tyrosine-phosphatase [Sodaliphilus sp.]